MKLLASYISKYEHRELAPRIGIVSPTSGEAKYSSNQIKQSAHTKVQGKGVHWGVQQVNDNGAKTSQSASKRACILVKYSCPEAKKFDNIFKRIREK